MAVRVISRRVRVINRRDRTRINRAARPDRVARVHRNRITKAAARVTAASKVAAARVTAASKVAAARTSNKVDKAGLPIARNNAILFN